MAEKINNAFHSAKGGAKESLGRGLGNEQMAAEGAAEKAQAQTRSNVNQAQQQVHGTADNLAGRTKATVGAATGNKSMEAQGHMQSATGDARRAVNK
ncbi:hypothetical protein BGZ75_001648 [Mortierella antarctica]|nr:hypothetical protein BGZ67_002075 [Mortierella alpina]KAF9990468.1 hypothetical protein BGZ75_001648 [Mortierella antarctica]